MPLLNAIRCACYKGYPYIYIIIYYNVRFSVSHGSVPSPPVISLLFLISYTVTLGPEIRAMVHLRFIVCF